LLAVKGLGRTYGDGDPKPQCREIAEALAGQWRGSSRAGGEVLLG